MQYVQHFGTCVLLSLSSSRKEYSLWKSNCWFTGGAPLKNIAFPMTVSWPIVTANIEHYTHILWVDDKTQTHNEWVYVTVYIIVYHEILLLLCMGTCDKTLSTLGQFQLEIWKSHKLCTRHWLHHWLYIAGFHLELFLWGERFYQRPCTSISGSKLEVSQSCKMLKTV